MWKHFITFLLIGVAAAWISGCSGISKAARSQVTYTGTFAQLQAAPEKYIDQTVILGGKIIATLVTENGTELTVLQLELGSSDRPLNEDQSKGRYLIRSAQFMDPALYPGGTLITVVGKLVGSEEKDIGQMVYRYPVITPLEVKKWPVENDASPRFHIGIGVGKTF